MIDRAHDLSLATQADLLGVARSTLYRHPRPAPLSAWRSDTGSGVVRAVAGDGDGCMIGTALWRAALRSAYGLTAFPPPQGINQEKRQTIHLY